MNEKKNDFFFSQITWQTISIHRLINIHWHYEFWLLDFISVPWIFFFFFLGFSDRKWWWQKEYDSKRGEKKISRNQYELAYTIYMVIIFEIQIFFFWFFGFWFSLFPIFFRSYNNNSLIIIMWWWCVW